MPGPRPHGPGPGGPRPHGGPGHHPGGPRPGGPRRRMFPRFRGGRGCMIPVIIFITALGGLTALVSILTRI